jgi:hypothetical protein
MADTKISNLTAYTTPLDADVLVVNDTANATTKKTTWANLKATLKTYLDTLYSPLFTTSAGLASLLSDETGSASGVVVFSASPTIVTPTIASMTNAQHNHTNAAGGGQITDAALSAAVGVTKGGTAGTSANAGLNNLLPTQTSNGGKMLKTDGSNTSWSTAVLFGGTGADGALAISSGTTTIDLASAAYVEKNYTSISITGTGKLAFTNPHANGTLVQLRSQGAVTLTATAPCIDMTGIGASAGTGGATTGTGTGGTNGQFQLDSTGRGGGAGTYNSGSTVTGGGALTSLPFYVIDEPSHARRFFPLFTGAGGGGGGGGALVTGANGGRGGGALLIECAGAWNFTTALGIDVSGLLGSNGPAAGVNSGGGGGGGGSGGSCLVLYGTLTANSGTIKKAGGNGGNGSTSTAGINQAQGGSGAGSFAGAGGTGGAGGAASTSGGTGSGSTGGTGGTGTAGSNAGGGGGGAEGYSYVALNKYFA